MIYEQSGATPPHDHPPASFRLHRGGVLNHSGLRAVAPVPWAAAIRPSLRPAAGGRLGRQTRGREPTAGEILRPPVNLRDAGKFREISDQMSRRRQLL